MAHGVHSNSMWWLPAIAERKKAGKLEVGAKGDKQSSTLVWQG